MKRVIAALAGTAVLALAGCGGDDEVDVQAFCDQAQEVQAASESLGGQLQGDDLDVAKTAMDEITGQLEAVADAAPAELSDDFDAITAYNTDLNDRIQKSESTDDLTKALALAAEDSADVEEASANLQTYVNDNCDEGG
ncbi:MAG: hypothetical protein ABI726_07805 [bacterium]